MKPVIPILLYHSIDDRAAAGFKPWTIGRAQFADHLDLLGGLGYHALSVTDLMNFMLAGKPEPEGTVELTFDDGLTDFSTNAWPQLKSRGLSATVYVTAGLVVGRSDWLAPLGAGSLPMLNSEGIRKLADDGVEIVAHSMTHLQMDCVCAAVARWEIVDSKHTLESILDRRVDAFAYPHGYHTRAIKKMVSDAGYTSAAAVRNASSHDQEDRFSLACVTVTSDYTLDMIERVLRGQGVERARPGERWWTTVWRQVRRFRAGTARFMS